MNYLSVGPFYTVPPVPTDACKPLDNTIFALMNIIQMHSASAFERIPNCPFETPKQKERFIRVLVKILNRYAPPFTYVGHAPNDELNWGVWIDLGKLHRAELKGELVQSEQEKPKGRSRYVLLHDKTGIRLFQRRGWVEVWKV